MAAAIKPGHDAVEARLKRVSGSQARLDSFAGKDEIPDGAGTDRVRK